MSDAGIDLIVVGAGHAGCEAAAAAARMGLQVVVVTLHRQTIAQMPCNPAVGGVGKGHLVVELDALGGIQGWAADRTGLQFRTLNRSRGPAVWGPRAQCDKGRYSVLMARLLSGLDGVRLIEAEAVGLLVDDREAKGVRLADGGRIAAGAVLLTTGTFLGGVLHTGDERSPGGRFGERPSVGLGRELADLGFAMRRFKTGTPPRLHRDSIDYERLQVQPGDCRPRPFSWRTRQVRNHTVCWVTRTPPVVQNIIGDNLHRSPLFSGTIEGAGPRYCPSIEDKVVRFPHHREHTVFLEPEGIDSHSIYVNGLSTSLPRDVQERVVRAVPGLARADFLRYGYAVEYDVVAPHQVAPSFASHEVPGLYLAGQLLGTSGYEEAAAQGFLAGVNVALARHGRRPLVLGRDQGYLGVLVDDLCSVDHSEPYRMFTSRAEHRLLLGVDTARERLMAIGVELGLVSSVAFHVEQKRWQRLHRASLALSEARVNPSRANRDEVRRIAGVELRTPTTWADILLRQEVNAEAVAAALPELAELGADERQIVIGQLRYDGYLVRHRREIERLRKLRHLEIPEDFNPGAIPGLSREVVEVLERCRPCTVADAERLPGLTPAAIAIVVSRLVSRRGRMERRDRWPRS